MLGLRRYKNYTLDLWVGKEEDFFCDLMIFLEKTPSEKKREAKEILILGKKDNLEEVISSKENLGHLVFVCPKDLDEEAFLQNLKQLLSSSKLPEKLRRVTLLTDDLEKHDKIWEHFKKIF